LKEMLTQPRTFLPKVQSPICLVRRFRVLRCLGIRETQTLRRYTVKIVNGEAAGSRSGEDQTLKMEVLSFPPLPKASGDAEVMA
jgi:hypothetical protein